MVECDLAKVEVASSNLVSRSKAIEKDEGGRRKQSQKEKVKRQKVMIHFYLFTSAF